MNLEQAADFVIEQAKRKSATAEVLATERLSTSVSFSERELDQFNFSETRELGIRIVAGKNEGLAYTESLDEVSLTETLDQAIQNAKMIVKDYQAELQGPVQAPAMPEVYNSALENLSTDEKIEFARKMEEAAYGFDKRIQNVNHCKFQDSTSRMLLANTLGLKVTHRSNGFFGVLTCLSNDGEASVSAGDSYFGRDPKQFPVEKWSAEIAQATVKMIGAKRPATGLYTAVLENRVAEQLIDFLTDFVNAKSVDEGRSPLAGKLGQTVLSPLLTIEDDPFFGPGLASRPFDSEGYASKKIKVFNQGRLDSYLTNSIYAKKMGLPHTAHAYRTPSTDLDISASNWVVASGQTEINQMLNSKPEVILITDILGKAGFRAASGDFSFPVEGYLYRNGQPVHALKDFLISGNILHLFSSVDAVGQDRLTPVGMVSCPSLLVHDLNISGTN
ncbi:MAG: TldD/PmbA family protein [Bdellovibrionales bacterium]